MRTKEQILNDHKAYEHLVLETLLDIRELLIKANKNQKKRVTKGVKHGNGNV